MKRTLIALLVCLAACGDDEQASAKESQTKGPAAAGGAQGLPCGAETCRVPDDAAGPVCCVDQFTGGCGMLIAGICRPLRSDKDDACPEPNLSKLAGYTAGSGAISSSISGCCARNNECGFDLGIGLGCSPAAQTCALLPRAILELHPAQTCDGEPLELPADCGQQ